MFNLVASDCYNEVTTTLRTKEIRCTVFFLRGAGGMSFGNEARFVEGSTVLDTVLWPRLGMPSFAARDSLHET
jgi:hypothetical protein